MVANFMELELYIDKMEKDVKKFKKGAIAFIEVEAKALKKK